MTLLISWIGADDNKGGKLPASLYIASDSRYSWSEKTTFETGIKTYGCINYPEIFGFCGDVLLPSLILNGVIPQIDEGLLFDSKFTAEQKKASIAEIIKANIDSYPIEKTTGQFTILYGTRIGQIFSCFKFSFNPLNGFETKEIQLPNESTIIYSGGSGGQEFDQNFRLYKSDKENNSRTSRGVYHCLIKTLNSIKDKRTGYVPQIMGLYRNKNRKLFGIIKDGKRYINGFEVKENKKLEGIEWRNDNFERVNPKDFKLLEGAQRQPF